MSDTASTTIATHFNASSDVMTRAATDTALLAAIETISAVITEAFRAGGKLLILGNGGSAADAQHIAAEFLSRMNFDRTPLPAIAITTDTSVLTAIGNDFGFDLVFERQVRALARAGDVVIAISTSGRSPNVLAALGAAKAAGAVTIGFTGARESAMTAACDHVLAAPSTSTPLVQQVHIVAAHAICTVVEDALFGPRPG